MNRKSLLAFITVVGLSLLAFTAAMTGMLMTVAGGPSADNPGGCAEGGAVPVAYTARPQGLGGAQLANAEAIIAEGYRLRVPRDGIVIALAVASQESGFVNYANDGKGNDLAGFQHGIEASLSLPHQGVGSDHGSLGVFQQQWPWWGSMEDLMNPTKAAEKFFKALLAVPGWETMSPTDAGQAVQHSAYPNAYTDDVPIAESLLATTPALADSTCASGAVSVGTVVTPLAPGTIFTDLHNFGSRGSHWSHEHTGTDFSTPCGSKVVAATNGTVVVRTDQAWAGPWLVEVTTGPGRLTTWYAHMRAVTVRPGEHVAAGQELGEVGDLGNATGCHLHFEVHPKGGDMYVDQVDPSAWLGQNVGHQLGGWEPASATSTAFTIATFNTLGSSHTTATGKAPSMGTGAERSRGVVDLLRQYDVDVVGLQEFQRPQYDAFRQLAGKTYQVFTAPGDTENAIAWKPERFRRVGSGTFSVPYFDGHPRQMPVVQLEDLRSGQHVVVVNVHNPADTQRFPNQATFRAQAVQKEIALVGRVEDQVGLPVILTGDLNDSRDAFCAFGQALKMLSASGGVTTPACHPAAHAGIDWILGTPSVQFNGYERDLSNLVRQTSDHPFVVTRASVGNDP